MLVDIDKEGTATITFNDFVEMVTPKVLARDPKVNRWQFYRMRVFGGDACLEQDATDVSCVTLEQIYRVIYQRMPVDRSDTLDILITRVVIEVVSRT